MASLRFVRCEKQKNLEQKHKNGRKRSSKVILFLTSVAIRLLDYIRFNTYIWIKDNSISVYQITLIKLSGNHWYKLEWKSLTFITRLNCFWGRLKWKTHKYEATSIWSINFHHDETIVLKSIGMCGHAYVQGVR